MVKVHTETLKKFPEFIIGEDTFENRAKANKAYVAYFKDVQQDILARSEALYPENGICNIVRTADGDVIWWSDSYTGMGIRELQHRSGVDLASKMRARAEKSGVKDWAFVGYAEDHYGPERRRRSDGAEVEAPDFGRDANLTTLKEYDAQHPLVA